MMSPEHMTAGFADLRSFLDRLRRDRDLVEITAPVDANQEAAEIHRRVIAAGGPALLFTNVRGARFPLVTNLFGTPRRAGLAFGTRPHALIEQLVHTAETILPPTPAKLWGARGLLGDLARVGLSRRGHGPVVDVVTDDVRLDELPIITSWPEDGGPFVTLPLVYTESPDRAGHNLGMYRLHVHDRRSTGLHWQIGKGGGFHYASAEARGADLPVTVFLGGPPALILAAIAPLPENVPELMLASLIAGSRLPLVAGRGPHPLVANAEFALMGRVRPHVRKPEGPFGDHYGYYSLQHDYPVFEIDRLARRRDAIYPATVVGKPRQEDFFIGDLLQTLLSPLFPLVMPAVRRLWSYGETGYHSLAAAVVRERYRREAMSSAFRILGEGQLSLTKFLLVTDRDVDLADFKATLTHVLARTRPEIGSLRVLEPVDGHARLHRAVGERGLEGRLARARRSGADAAGGVLVGRRPGRRARRARLLSRLPRRRGTGLRVGARRRGADRDVAGLRRVAAGRPERRRRARHAQPDELPVDDVHALRAGRRHPRRGDPRRAQSRRADAADRDRRAHEAVVPEGAELRSGRRRDGDAPLARVLPVRRRDGRFGEGAPGLALPQLA